MIPEISSKNGDNDNMESDSSPTAKKSNVTDQIDNYKLDTIVAPSAPTIAPKQNRYK